MSQPIVVKFLARGMPKGAAGRWVRQFPHANPVWGRCRFVFDADERRYDWLVVYDDLPGEPAGRFTTGREPLACPRRHTLLITAEPSSIKTYGRRFVAQFGHVLTSQEPWALDHPGAVRSQPALRWFYGLGSAKVVAFDALRDFPPTHKTRMISIVASSKQQRHTLHHRRYHFARELKARLPELEVFGHGVRDMDDKAEALDAFRYHVAVENFVGPHHWTEKLADAFLGCTLPFYFGCPNAADYFPEESFVPIDIFDPDGSARIIRAAIDGGEYERRLRAIMEARRRVLYEYNIFAVVSRLIEERHSPMTAAGGETLLSRHALRFASPIHAIEDMVDKVRWRMESRGAR